LAVLGGDGPTGAHKHGIGGSDGAGGLSEACRKHFASAVSAAVETNRHVPRSHAIFAIGWGLLQHIRSGAPDRGVVGGLWIGPTAVGTAPFGTGRPKANNPAGWRKRHIWDRRGWRILPTKAQLERTETCGDRRNALRCPTTGSDRRNSPSHQLTIPPAGATFQAFRAVNFRLAAPHLRPIKDIERIVSQPRRTGEKGGEQRLGNQSLQCDPVDLRERRIGNRGNNA